MVEKITTGKKKKLDSNELQLLALLAKKYGFDKLHSKLCAMMFQDMHLVSSLEQIYTKIYTEHKDKFMSGAEPFPITQEKANRLAVRWAVKNTAKEWRKQFDDSAKTTN